MWVVLILSIYTPKISNFFFGLLWKVTLILFSSPEQTVRAAISGQLWSRCFCLATGWVSECFFFITCGLGSVKIGSLGVIWQSIITSSSARDLNTEEWVLGGSCCIRQSPLWCFLCSTAAPVYDRLLSFCYGQASLWEEYNNLFSSSLIPLCMCVVMYCYGL